MSVRTPSSSSVLLRPHARGRGRIRTSGAMRQHEHQGASSWRARRRAVVAAPRWRRGLLVIATAATLAWTLSTLLGTGAAGLDATAVGAADELG